MQIISSVPRVEEAKAVQTRKVIDAVGPNLSFTPQRANTRETTLAKRPAERLDRRSAYDADYWVTVPTQPDSLPEYSTQPMEDDFDFTLGTQTQGQVDGMLDALLDQSSLKLH